MENNSKNISVKNEKSTLNTNSPYINGVLVSDEYEHIHHFVSLYGKECSVFNSGYMSLNDMFITTDLISEIEKKYDYEYLSTKHRTNNKCETNIYSSLLHLKDKEMLIYFDFCYIDDMGENLITNSRVCCEEDFCKESVNVEDDMVILKWKIYYNKSNTSTAELPKNVKELFSLIKSFTFFKDKKRDINIGMVSMSNGQFYVKHQNISDKIKLFENLDENYGKGFENFNDNLLHKLKTDTKGLVLLHGLPGTGKTFYIRHLLSELSNSGNCDVLYFPPSMVSSITDPSFMDFIGEWVSGNRKKIVLLIEDAEILLETRNSVRNMGITNLLNLTDGILNDCFGLQIIATFNTALCNIDEALLRPGRLIARKEFGELSIEQLETLSKKIGLKRTFDNPMTLSEFYCDKNKEEVLVHEVSKKQSIGF